jgi:RNA polymerase sigma-70 factor, ECF subfamily
MSQANPRFEATVMPHLDAAYNLARWLVKDEHAAEDVVQDAYLRAFRYFDSFHGMDARPWLLGIVRNSCYSWLETAKRSKGQVEFDEEREMDESADTATTPGRAENPETLLMRKAEKAELNAAIRSLPTTFREVLILREIEEMPYDTIAAAMQIPIGTVMSRLSRARSLLRAALETTMGKRLYGT